MRTGEVSSDIQLHNDSLEHQTLQCHMDSNDVKRHPCGGRHCNGGDLRRISCLLASILANEWGVQIHWREYLLPALPCF